jgi:cobalt-precorrin-5B (C1)-methyltransferase
MLKDGRVVREYTIDLPGRPGVTFPIEKPEISPCRAACAVRKDAGDDPDVTNGMLIHAEVTPAGSPNGCTGEKPGAPSPRGREQGISIQGGTGIGRVTRQGLQVPVGSWAINPGPLRMIRQAVRPWYESGVQVTISAPGGEEVAARTFNPRLGIQGGISILGTTGIVKPFSVSALKTSLELEVDVAAASGAGSIFLVPGNIGKAALVQRYPAGENRIVMMSNFVGALLSRAAGRFDRILLAGHPGKLAKLTAGDFDTHSSRSGSALPLVVSRAAGMGLADSAVRASATVEGVVQALDPAGRARLFDRIASEVEEAARVFIENRSQVGVLLVDMSHTVLGRGPVLAGWEEEGWQG